jgi:hypothetical protein
VLGEKFGLELVEWLSESQTTVSVSNQASRMSILETINSENADCPSPLVRVLICDRLNVPFQKHDRGKYVREIYRLTADYALRWEPDQPIPMWPVRDLSPYPTLARYCHCVTLYGPPYPVTAPSGDALYGLGKRWIDFEVVGGVYDPQWSVDALLSRISSKTRKYRNIHRTQNLDHFALLAHYGIRGLLPSLTACHQLNRAWCGGEFLKGSLTFLGNENAMSSLLMSATVAFAEFEQLMIRMATGADRAAKSLPSTRALKPSLKTTKIAEIRKRVATEEKKTRLAAEYQISRQMLYMALGRGELYRPLSRNVAFVSRMISRADDSAPQTRIISIRQRAD